VQLTGPLLAAMLLAALPAAASAQSLAPTHGTGPTPSNIKGFRLTVGNPYKTAMSFAVVPTDPGFSVPAGDAVVQPDRLTLAPGFSRQVILAFKIPPRSRERTIGLCVTPQGITGPVLPRVCGTYTGVLLARQGS
jgi:hypothetical protein